MSMDFNRLRLTPVLGLGVLLMGVAGCCKKSFDAALQGKKQTLMQARTWQKKKLSPKNYVLFKDLAKGVFVREMEEPRVPMDVRPNVNEAISPMKSTMFFRFSEFDSNGIGIVQYSERYPDLDFSVRYKGADGFYSVPKMKAETDVFSRIYEIRSEDEALMIYSEKLTLSYYQHQTIPDSQSEEDLVAWEKGNRYKAEIMFLKATRRDDTLSLRKYMTKYAGSFDYVMGTEFDLKHLPDEQAAKNLQIQNAVSAVSDPRFETQDKPASVSLEALQATDKALQATSLQDKRVETAQQSSSGWMYLGSADSLAEKKFVWTDRLVGVELDDVMAQAFAERKNPDTTGLKPIQFSPRTATYLRNARPSKATGQWMKGAVVNVVDVKDKCTIVHVSLIPGKGAKYRLWAEVKVE